MGTKIVITRSNSVYQNKTFFSCVFYILFFSMTGVGGRPELIIEGSNNLNGEWKVRTTIYFFTQYQL